MALLILRLSPGMWKSFSDEQISQKIAAAPYVIDAYRVAEQNASHVLLLAFRDVEQKERYIKEVQTTYASEVTIRAVYTFSVEKIISRSPLGTLHEIIDRSEFSPEDIFLDHADE